MRYRFGAGGIGRFGGKWASQIPTEALKMLKRLLKGTLAAP